MKHNFEKIVYNKQLYALIIRSKNQFKEKGVNFFTNDNDLLQVGFLKHGTNHQIRSHIHLSQKRTINYSSEVLIIKKGILKVIFFNNKANKILRPKTLYKNDIIILFKGGHGFKILKNCEIIEIKQGPYILSKDKVKFDNIVEKKISIKK